MLNSFIGEGYICKKEDILEFRTSTGKLGYSFTIKCLAEAHGKGQFDFFICKVYGATAEFFKMNMDMLLHRKIVVHGRIASTKNDSGEFINVLVVYALIPYDISQRSSLKFVPDPTSFVKEKSLDDEITQISDDDIPEENLPF